MACAAADISRNVASALGALPGLTSTAIRTALGTSSCSSPSRFATTSLTKKLMPVALPPGNAGDQTKPDRVFADAEDDRDRRGRSFGRKGSRVAPGRGDNGHATAHEVGHERWQAIVLALQPVVLDRYILALDVAGFVEALTERNGTARIGRPAVEDRKSTRLNSSHTVI